MVIEGKGSADRNKGAFDEFRSMIGNKKANNTNKSDNSNYYQEVKHMLAASR